MNQRIEELKIELSMLYADLQDTQSLIDEKTKELKLICSHDKVVKNILADKRYPLDSSKFKFEYICGICGEKMFRDEEDPDLEENRM